MTKFSNGERCTGRVGKHDHKQFSIHVDSVLKAIGQLHCDMR